MTKHCKPHALFVAYEVHNGQLRFQDLTEGQQEEIYVMLKKEYRMSIPTVCDFLHTDSDRIRSIRRDLR